MSAILPYCKFHLYSTAACFSNMKPCMAKVTAAISAPSRQRRYLRVRNDLRRQQRIAYVLLEGVRGRRDVAGASQDLRSLPAHTRDATRARENRRHQPALVHQRRHAAREHGLAHEGERHAEVGSVHARPLARAFLAGSVEDEVDKVALPVSALALEAAHASHKTNRIATARDAGPYAKMSAVMSIRKESRSPVLHLQARA
jgi:hypothetical protein